MVTNQADFLEAKCCSKLNTLSLNWVITPSVKPQASIKCGGIVCDAKNFGWVISSLSRIWNTCLRIAGQTLTNFIYSCNKSDSGFITGWAEWGDGPWLAWLIFCFLDLKSKTGKLDGGDNRFTPSTKFLYKTCGMSTCFKSLKKGLISTHHCRSPLLNHAGS